MNGIGPALTVARAFAYSWIRRPIRLTAAITAGIGGVMLTTAVLLIAATVLGAVRSAPVQGFAAGTLAVEAQSPAGMSADLVDKIGSETGTVRSRMLVGNTKIDVDGEFTSVVVLGVDLNLPRMLEPTALSGGNMGLLAPNTVYMSRDWATDKGIADGDTVTVSTPTGRQQWKVAGLLEQDFANGGAVLVAPIGNVATAFDRGDRTDVLLMQPGAGASGDAIADKTRSLLDGAAVVKAPADLLSGYNRTFKTPLSILAMFAAIAIMTSGVVLFLTWRLVLADAAPILSRLRLLGARHRDLILGSGAVMLPILLFTYLIGAVAGLFLGSRLSAFTTQITNLTQQALNPGFPWLPAVLGAFGGAVVMFGFAWLSGLRRLRSVAPIDAMNNRDTQAVRTSKVTAPLAGAVVAVVLGVLILLLAPPLFKSAALVPLLFAVAVLATVLPVLAGAGLRTGTSGPTGMFVGRHLEVGWRRNAALTITFAVAMVMSISMSGVSTSIKNEVGNSVDRWSSVDLFVQAAPTGELLTGEALPMS
ncbi:FtsX-like permease family protein, partial [Nocardia cyriacigeorgica]